MPEICRFDGICVYVYFSDHNPPHFHAEYAEFRLKVNIRNISVSDGYMPPRVTRRILSCAREHQSELMDAWDAVMGGRTPARIAPPPGQFSDCLPTDGFDWKPRLISLHLHMRRHGRPTHGEIKITPILRLHHVAVVDVHVAAFDMSISHRSGPKFVATSIQFGIVDQ